MSKKNKNKSAQFETMSFYPFEEPKPMAGQLRFHKKVVEKAETKWWGTDYKILGESKKILQQFDGQTWRNIPFEREYIEL